MPTLRAALCLFSAVLPFACQAQTITVTSGNNQTTLLNSAFPKPLVVTVLDASGNPLSGITVTYSGSGIVTTTAVTGANGQASAVVTANSVLGGSTVSANAVGGEYGILGSLVYATTIFTLTNADAACVPYVTVTSTSDSGTGSLREALADICPGGTVDLSRLSTPSTITLQSRLYIYQDVTILGPPTGTLTVSGNNSTRLFFIQAGNVAIENVTLANGYGKGGDSYNNSGTGAGMGGAIFQNGGNVTLTNVNFIGNQTVGGNGGVSSTSVGCGGFGTDTTSFDCAGDLGGVGTGTPVVNVSFSGGDGGVGGHSGPVQIGAGLGGGGPGGFGGGGGAGQFSHPYVGGAGNGGFGGGGGAEGGYGAGNGYVTYQNNPSLFPGTFVGGGAAGFGGAIFERKGTLVLNSVRFSTNGSVAGTSIAPLDIYGAAVTGTNYSPGQAKGGALFVYSGATATFNNVTFGTNTAADAGAPGIGNSAAPYTNGATCPGNDNVNVCGQVPSISAAPTDSTQTTVPNSAFLPLSVKLNDSNGNPLSGVGVVFTAPASGPSGIFSNFAASITVPTDASGVATAPFAANNISGGPYTVTATANGLTQVFTLTNSPQFVTSQTPGPSRNDYSGFVGLEFTVGPRNATAYSLGRFVITGNTQNHLVKLVQANGSDVPGGSVTVPTSGATAGTYQYVALASPVSLLANTTYFLVSQETAGGDFWYNYGPVTSAPIAVVNAPVYTDGHGNYVPVTALPGDSFVPVSFLAAPTNAGLTVAITSPAANATLSGTASITVSATGPVATLQIQVDGVSQGSPVPVTASQGPSYTLTLNTTALTVGTHLITVVAVNSSSNLVTSDPVSVTVNNTPTTTTATPFVLGQTPGPLRNNYTGFVGQSLTVGSTPITVTSLGRYVAPGDSATHLLKLVTVNETDLPGASVSLSLLGTAPGAFQYASLPTPITLQPNTSYYLVSQETAGGDGWYDLGSIETSIVASVIGPVYTDGQGHYITVPGLPNYSYVPLSFLYGSATTTAALSATITSPQAGAFLSGNVPVTISTTGTVTTLQLQVDGIDLGAPAPSSPITLDTALLSNGPHTLTVVATNGTATVTSPGVNITVSNTITTLTTFTTAQSPAVLRNNYTGYVGMTIQVGPTPLTVATLGRFVVAGNNGTHILKLVQANGTDLPGALVTLTLGAGDTPGQYLYAPLPAPMTLAANTTYYLVSQETSGGDQWYDLAPITTTTAAQVIGAAYTDGQGNYVTVGGLPGYSYVPLSFQYQ